MELTNKDFINKGGKLLDKDPVLAQKFLGLGIKYLPEVSIAYFNLGIGLHQRKQIAAAIRAYKICLNLENAPLLEARNNLGQDLLLLGLWKEGWQMYEHRFNRKPGNFPIFQKLFGDRHFGPLKKKENILIMNEQGLGDTLQFSRFALELQNQGHNITLLSQPSLVPLLREGTDIKRIEYSLDADEEKKLNPSWIPLLSIPNLLGTIQDTIPLSNTYIRACPKRKYKWKKLLQRRTDHLLIALHWQGNPKHEKSLYSRGRSMKFEHFLKLQGINGIEFVSIQKGFGSEQLELKAGLNFVKGQDSVSSSLDFRDTAAIIANCDLVISTDSAVIHLAGAMGIPTFLCLRWIAEWRWGLKGNTSFWYDSVRLFRQNKDGDWDGVIKRIKVALIKFKQEKIISN